MTVSEATAVRIADHRPGDPVRASETRARIIAAAEEHFRLYGYRKTTVADIARSLGMSPANIYRFFESKSAINEAIAERILGEMETHARQIAGRDLPAGERLCAFIREIHQQTRERYVDETRLHDMVSAAVEEQWHVIEQHIARIALILTEIIADGMARGEFQVGDPARAATAVHAAVIKFHHPCVLVQRLSEDLDRQAEVVGAMLVAALRQGF